MSNKILVVLAFSANDAVLAEHLADWIYLVNRREQEGDCLLVVAGDVHDEMRDKVKLAAQVAFERVDIITGPKLENPNKNVHVNAMVKAAAQHITETYRVPWLWLEPDCVPLKYGWLDKIAEAHYNQAKRYSGPWKGAMAPDGKVTQIFLNRVAVYPPDAMKDIGAGLNSGRPFNLDAGPIVHPKSSKVSLIEELTVTEESASLKPATVLAHSDKQGFIMNAMRERFEQAAKKK